MSIQFICERCDGRECQEYNPDSGDGGIFDFDTVTASYQCADCGAIHEVEYTPISCDFNEGESPSDWRED